MESDSKPVSHIETKIEKWILKYDADQWTEMDFSLVTCKYEEMKRCCSTHSLDNHIT